ncbi:MAG: hypothetical protein DU481_01340 [Nitrosomonas sp.]|uniref:hypothetical protein n=1 Tax=Nitrosomonas sp. TaxID=42353 RepID=UPI0032EC8940
MHRFLSFQPYQFILLLFIACNSPTVFANGFSFSTATDFTTGKYGGPSATDIWYVPFTARYDKGRASFRVTLPYLNMTGPGNVLGPGIGGIDGRGTIINGGGVSGGSSGGGIVICDEQNINCPMIISENGNNSGSGGNSSSGGSGSDDDEDDGSSGSGSGDDDDDDSGSGGGSDDGSGSDDSGGGDDDDDGGDDSSSGGSDDGSGDDDSGDDDGSGGSDDGDDDSTDAIGKLRQLKVGALGLAGGIPLGGSPLSSTSRSGLGDLVTAFSYNLIDHAPTGIAFDITARLKIPTASTSQNLGTGQVDYAIQGDLFKTISNFTLSATFGYRILGNPSNVTFHNVFYGGAGIGYRLSGTVTVGTSYNMGQSPVRLQDSRDLTLYLSQRVNNNFRLNIYGLKGFSERSPDWGGGINLRYVF